MNNYDKIDWSRLSNNFNAIDLLKENYDNIDWNLISYNPNIFELNNEYIKQHMYIIKEELMQYTWHPKRILKLLESGVDIEDI